MISVEKNASVSNEFREGKTEALLVWWGSVAIGFVLALLIVGIAIYYQVITPPLSWPSAVCGMFLCGCVLGWVNIYNIEQSYARKNEREKHLQFIKGRNRILLVYGGGFFLLGLIALLISTIWK